MKNILYTITGIVMSVFATSVVAYAVTTPPPSQQTNQPGQALEIAPPVLNLKANPGDTVEGTINLRDITSTSLVVSGTVDDFTANGEDGVPKILLDNAEPTPYSLKEWVQPLSKITLEPRQIKSLPVTIKVPKDASPGGYYGVVRFTASATDMDTSGVSLSASLGALVFLRVSGDAKESLALDKFTVSKSATDNAGWMFESQPLTFNERINNTGNVFEQPTGQITVTDMFGNTVANVNVNLERRSILPGTVRKLSQSLDKTNIGDRMLFGLYHAKISLTYGESKQTLTSETSFWVIPWKLIIGGIILVIAIVFGIRMMMKRHADQVTHRVRGSRRR